MDINPTPALRRDDIADLLDAHADDLATGAAPPAWVALRLANLAAALRMRGVR